MDERAALAGVLVVTAYGMVDRKEMRRIWHAWRGDRAGGAGTDNCPPQSDNDARIIVQNGSRFEQTMLVEPRNLEETGFITWSFSKEEPRFI